jgi:hypothetical protein
MGNGRVQMSPYNRRVREIIVRAWGPYLAVAMLVWAVEIAMVAGIARASFPDADLNSWPFIALLTPPLLLAIYLNYLIATVLFVRDFTRRKGRAKAVQYLFAGDDVKKRGVIGRILLAATGIRGKEHRSG